MAVYKYIGQCDILRKSPYNDYWFGKMIDIKSEINIDNFLRTVSNDELTKLLEDESLIDFISSDPESKFYKSKWVVKDCVFIQTCGFEFIFVSQ